MEIWIGTSGYSYSDWVGEFYPPGTSPSRMLVEYARRFPLVELNFTYYGMPTATTLAGMARKTPPGFQFLVKLHGSFTHEGDLTQAPAFRDALKPLQDDDKLMALLAQFPQRFHEGAENRRYLERLAQLFADCRLAVEFRHASWDRPDVFDWLRQAGLHIVSVDAPAIPTLFPTKLVHTSRLIYVRLHSRSAANWYGGEGKDRYDYFYSDDELREWLTWLAAARDQADRALLLFNNCFRSQAAANAQRVAELLRELTPELIVVPPIASTGPSQGRLFG
jgi:uncharacterized protein YecE (DUF72 family)